MLAGLKSRPHWGVALTMSLAALSSTTPVSAQTAPPVTTPSIVPRAADLAPKPQVVDTDPAALPLTPKPRELQKPEEEILVDVSAFAVANDAPPKLREALAALTAPYIGPGKSWEDLINAKDTVTRFLQSQLGYYLGYAYIPEQSPVAGVIRIDLIEGRLDQVKLLWDDKLSVDKKVVEGYLSRLRPGAILTVAEVERVVFLINDLRGITVRFEIEPGSKPGTANLVVRPQAENRLAYKFDVDVNGSRFIGLERVGAQLIVASPLGLGDSVSLSALTSTNSGMRFVLAGYSAPVGGNGLRLGGAISAVSYELDKVAFPIGRTGSALSANLFALYPVIRSRNLNLFALLALDEKRYDDREQASASITKKRVQSVSVAANGDARDSLATGGVNSYDFSLSGGSVTYDNGRPSGLIDSPDYTKLNATVSRIQNIVTGRLLAYVSLRGQYGFKNLDTTEQFRLGGPDGIRAFANGEGTGDSGALLTVEMRAPLTFAFLGPVAREAVFALFADYGTIQFRHDPSRDTTLAGLNNQATYAGVGAALAWVRAGKYALRISVATPTQGQAKGDTVNRNPRIYAQFSAFF